MNSALLSFAEWLAQRPFSIDLHESFYLYNWIETTHVMTLMLSLGMLFIIDLRVLGVFLRDVPVRRVIGSLRPWVLCGFAVIFITGVLLFWSAAGRLVLSPAFPIKLLLIALAGVNALYFELTLARSGATRADAALPASARAAGLASLVLWSLVIAFGRLIPYLPAWT